MPDKAYDLSQRVLNGLWWVACGKGAQVGLQFLVLTVLARLILPGEFGVVGAAMVVIGFSEIITELGLAAAIVQRENLEDRHLATAFSFALLFSCLAGAVIYLLAPLLAEFFDSARLEPVLHALALLFPIRGISTVGDALAQREMRFRWLAVRDTVSFGIGYLLFGFALAVLGFGVWALVAANLVTAAARTLVLIYSYPPKSIRPERQALVDLLYFGGGHTAARVSNYVALQGDNLVIGRVLGLYSLGIYGRAYQLMGVPASAIGQVMDQVLFPSMAKIQGDRERLAWAYLRGVNLVALVALPASVLGFILAPELISLILGDKWNDVVFPFRILTLGLLMRTSYKLSDSLARATGAVYRRAWRQLIYAIMVVVGAWAGHFWGVSGSAAGVLAAVAINFVLMAQMSLCVIGSTWKEFYYAHHRALISAGGLVLLVYPLVFGLRRVSLSPGFHVIAVGLVVVLLAVGIIRTAPRLLLGQDGVWLIATLQDHLPKWLRSSALTASTDSNVPYGVEDAGLENA